MNHTHASAETDSHVTGHRVRPADRQAVHEHLKHEVHHYAHMLSEQGPMNITFVHNNTLLGLQSLHFEAAIREAQRVLGARGYEPIANFRGYFDRGRITEKDVERALDERESMNLGEVVAQGNGRAITRRDIVRAAMRHDLKAVEPATLQFAVEQDQALEHFAPGLAPAARERLLQGASDALKADLARIGEDRLLCDWVGELLGLDLRGALCQALRDLAEHGAHPVHGDVRTQLAALGLPEARHAGYLKLVQSLLKGADAGDARGRDALMLAALEEEQHLLADLCQRHWSCAGRYDVLSALFAERIESFAVAGLWRAVMDLLDIDDPFSRTDAGTLQARDLRLDQAEAESEQLQVARSAGGSLPTLITDSLRRRALGLIGRVHGQASGGSGYDLDHLVEQLEDGAVDAQGMATLRDLAEREGSAESQALTRALQDAESQQQRRTYVENLIASDRDRLRRGRTHADWLRDLTGEDLGEQVNHYMIRVCAAFLDEGLAAWRMPDRSRGFYAAWRANAERDVNFSLEGLDDWSEQVARLPDDAADAVVSLLDRLGVDDADWGEYLGRCLARLKGWAGMVFWYESHPKHYKQSVQPIDTIQYLAVRLFHEWMLVRKTCEELWGLDGHADRLKRAFEIQADEYLVRRELHAGHLPDMLADLARRELAALSGGRRHPSTLRGLADAVWLHCLTRRVLVRTASEAWPLFLLSQHLGLGGRELAALGAEGANALLRELKACVDDVLCPIWLRAYECHYRDEVLNALAQNHGRGRWARGRNRRPRSQLVLCIDEREENLHRHYGELDPNHETLGAAGFFGVAQSFIALDDHLPTPLCPAVATPAHQILEIPRPEALHAEFPVHKTRVKWKEVFDGAYWETKRNVVASFFLIQLAGLLMAVPLIGRVFAPRRFSRWSSAVGHRLIPPVRTRLTHVRTPTEDIEGMGIHTHGLPIGFQISEGADRVEAQLRNWGLTYQFARIVVICAHRSFSVNNPHENAHDCGACGGKAGGPNSRLFAALANDPSVREELRRRGIDIPDDTWFVGAEHNTCSDQILCFDTEDIPASLRADWQLVYADLQEAKRRAARERCRRFGSAPKDASLEASVAHVEGRSNDLSQVRPEWGHATNAFALVGRRCLTQGLFFDRRGFIISYDPTQDPDGKIVERILLAVGPVGAGINLEYYFSTVDPDNFGCGTKVPHNVTGMIGVMAGAHGDLQTGLPRQMTEVHEAMRLQLIVDAKMSVLGEIYGRQPGIRQLLDNQWVHLIAHDPDTGELNLFVPGKGFVKWDEPLTPLPEVNESYDWYRGKHECFLPPCRIKEPTMRWTEKARLH